jgi:hypothetical protein
MKQWILCLLPLAGLIACKSKKKNNDENGPWFSVKSYLQSQAKNVDTSLYRIIKIDTIDSTSDTTVIPREDFRKYAKDFLDVPDISSDSKKDDYQESRMYDEELNKVILTYTTNKPDEEIRREDVMLENDQNGNSQVKTIIINKLQTENNTTVEKDMVWQVDKRFLVVTKTDTPQGPEKIKKLEVVWNDFPN